MDNCTFCKIISRQIQGFIVDEDAHVITFLSLESHPLVVPKKHITDIYSLDEATGNNIMIKLINVAKAVKKGLDCDGVYITQANGAAAGQDVFHLHFHVYPRWEGKKENEEATVEAAVRELTLHKIKNALR